MLTQALFMMRGTTLKSSDDSAACTRIVSSGRFVMLNLSHAEESKTEFICKLDCDEHIMITFFFRIDQSHEGAREADLVIFMTSSGICLVSVILATVTQGWTSSSHGSDALYIMWPKSVSFTCARKNVSDKQTVSGV